MENVIGVMGIDFTVNSFYQLMQQVFPECAESLCVNYWECLRYTVTSLTYSGACSLCDEVSTSLQRGINRYM